MPVIYKTSDGTLKDRLLNRGDEAGLSVATTERPWSFDGDGETFTPHDRRTFFLDPAVFAALINVSRAGFAE